ncbi:MAG: ATP-binding protein [Phaeodactylibacter sp.]|nr:ATP-binding protein [Phaeodactylibacter sp.]MCB9304245.1 ATP-binding protein [Lewinellaceae bacterium]
MFIRIIKAQIEQDLRDTNKIIILYGPRQVGKTTLVKELLEGYPNALSINADQLLYNEVFSARDLRKMQELIGTKNLLFIDEAQNIRDIGINLKILHDEMPDLKIIATGSSSFELANNIREPLTGRTKTYRLFPISAEEIIRHSSVFEFKNQIEPLLLYGAYPEILRSTGVENKIDRLDELTSAYLYKDVLQLSGIKYADKIRKLLQMLALQIGSTVSLNEIGKALGMSYETVANYIDLLEKGFIIFRLSGYSNNPRKEITKMNKIYFHDLGVRNNLINNYNPLALRTDTGALWENFLIVERMKKIKYARELVNSYFWRTYTGVELDYVEETGGMLYGFEMKWNKSAKAPATWLENYPNAQYACINRDNFVDFVSNMANT